MRRKGQAVIFVIVAIVLVASIVVFFVLYRGPGISIGEEFEPESKIDGCFREAIRDSVDLMLPHGGFAEPQNSIIYKDIEVAYLCENVNYYQRCIVQHPLYISDLDNELEKNIEEDVKECFFFIQEDLEGKGYSVSGEDDFSYDIVLKPGIIELEIDREFKFERDGEVNSFEGFSAGIAIPLYDLGQVVSIIVEQESRNCYFEYVGYMNLYPRWSIDIDVNSEDVKVYTVKDKESGIETSFAIRGCAIPAGLG